jgi:tetratricopeptide (TPR) repeat protein
VILAVLVVVGTSVPSYAQTAEDTVRAYKEEQELFNKASSRGDMEKALQKFEAALSGFQRNGEKKGESCCRGYIGTIYDRWGQYAKALEYYEKAP